MIAVHDSEKASMLCNYFSSVFTNDNGILPQFDNRVPLVWTQTAENRLGVDVLYIDLAKAFDSVCHAKLSHYGFNGNILKWLEAFLTDRTQAVRIGSATSAFLPVISGVPQGSVLGPLLFILYVNDVTDVVPQNIKIKLFADDIKLYASIASVSDCDSLQQCFADVHSWSASWQLKINLVKCNV